MLSAPGAAVEIRLTRQITSGDEDEPLTREEVLLAGASAPDAMPRFAAGKSDLVLGGDVRRSACSPARQAAPQRAAFRSRLRPVRACADPRWRAARQTRAPPPAGAGDRPRELIAALGVPGLRPRATVLEPGLDGIPAPVRPAGSRPRSVDRLAGLRAQADRLFGKQKPDIRVALPDGPGGDLLFQELKRDWGMIGLTVDRAEPRPAADFGLIDEVAPSSSAAWFVRRFRCGAVAVCDPQPDQLMDAARETPVPAQRYALLFQAAAGSTMRNCSSRSPRPCVGRWCLTASRASPGTVTLVTRSPTCSNSQVDE